ncbi:MAG: beta-lactamase family protein [Myxococcaceae bacterium]|nr:beta-lactamase family protein [Myxococcaceae bacterium]
MKLTCVLTAALLTTACATPQPVPTGAAPTTAPVTPAATKLESDTPLKSLSGATATAPKGWYLSQRQSTFVLEDPDRELMLVLTENNAAEGQKAIAAAWKEVQPGFARKVENELKVPAKDGWDEILQLRYEVPSAESRFVVALARRKAAIWYVALIDGTLAAVDRRTAQAMTTINSLKVAGAEEESYAQKKAQPLTGERAEKFTAFLENALKAAQVPGAAIAVLQDGKTVYEKAFGVREVGKPGAVTPATLFMIGSTTKSLTSLLMARLVDEKKLTWDTPLVSLMPSFALADAEVTKKVLVKHTVCACTGLPRQDLEFLFEYANVTPEQRVASMRTMKPTTGFGETFQYSNTLVSTGGYAAALALGEKKQLGPMYDNAMQTRILGPLGMTSTTFDFKKVAQKEHATSHARNLERTYLPMPMSYEQNVEAVRPAGGAWSNVRDMARYVALELGNGTLDGKVLVSDENIKARRQPRVKITDKVHYGLGLFLENDHGVQVFGHGGNNMGFTSDLFFLPEHGVGVVLLTNAGNANAFRQAVKARLMELLFDGKEEAQQQLDFALEQTNVQYKKLLEKVRKTPDAAWLAKWVGRYEAEGLGAAEITQTQDGATFDAGEWKSALGQQPDTDGTQQLVLLSPPFAGLDIIPSESEGRPVLIIQAPQQTYTFKKVVAPRR